MVPSLPPRPQLGIDDAEFLALRTIVSVMVGMMAKDKEVKNEQPAQALINNIAEASSEAVATSQFHLPSRVEEKFRQKAIDKIHQILSSIKVEPLSHNAN
jgi:hypothetical protein